MKRLLLSVLIASLTVAGVTPPPAVASEPLDTSLAAPVRPGTARTPTVVVNDKRLKVVPGNQTVGPRSFAIDSGRIYVHNEAKNAIRVYTLAGKFQRSVRLSERVNVADMAIRGGQLTLLDIDGRLHKFRLGKAKAKASGFAATPSVSRHEPGAAQLGGVGVSQISYFGDQLVGELAPTGHLVLTKGSFLNKAPGSLLGNTVVSQAGKTLSVKSVSSSEVKRFTVPNEPVQAVESYREPGYSYFTVSDRYRALGGTWLYNTWVYKYADSGALVASYSLTAQSTYTPGREFAVYRGAVYQLRIGTTHAQVLRLTPDNQGQPAPTKASNLAVPQGVAAAGVPRRALAIVLKRAKAMASAKWTYIKSRHGKISAVPKSERYRVRQARQLRGIKKSKKVASYPYAWGGYDTADTHSGSSTWKNFSKALKSKTVYVSNVKSHATKNWVPNTAGVDCSGFVSSAFELGDKRGTGNMIDNNKRWFKKLKSIDQARTGDILNHSGNHVVIVLGWVDKAKTRIRVIESTTWESFGYVKTSVRTSKHFRKGHYDAARFQNWAPDPTKCVRGRPCAKNVSK